MKVLKEKRCIIGEGPIWNEREQALYFTNGFQKEVCIYNFMTEQMHIRTLPFGASAIAFEEQGNLILSHAGGVHILTNDDTLIPLYDPEKYAIKRASDMKIGPDGAIYVGTISEKFLGISEKLDGKLYRISQDGKVDILLDGLSLSNGLEWSMDETKFYHADTGKAEIKEYYFDKATGEIKFSGRKVCIEGADGLTIGRDNCLYVSCAWKKYVAVVDCATLSIVSYISPPKTFPMSCCFCGENMDVLAVTTASDTADLEKDENAGFTVLAKQNINGRKPYLFKCL